MSKLSVKKPFTVLVGVIIAIVLGIVSLYKMQLDLLPEMSLPYVLVITTYPGASPETVEADVCKPMESALGKINGVKNIYSECHENYGLVELEFQDDTDLDSAMVKVSSAINTLESSLPNDCGTPSIMQISMDMMASVYLAVSLDGKSIEETSQFVEDYITPQFEKQDGVASVTSLGLVEKSIQIELNEEKVDALNAKILASLDSNKQFIDAEDQLNDAKKQLEKSEESLQKSKDKLEDSQNDIYDGIQDLLDGQKELDTKKGEFDQSVIDYEEGKEKLEKGQDELKDKKKSAENEMAEASYQMDLYSSKMDALESQLFDVQVYLAEKSKILEQYKEELSNLEEGTPEYNDKAIEITTIKNEIDVKIGEKSGLDSLLSDYKEKLTALEKGKIEAAAGFGSADAQLSITKSQLESAEKQFESGSKSLKDAQEQIDDGWQSLADGQQQIWDGWDDIKDGEEQIADGWEDYFDGVKSFEKQKLEAAKKANADELLDLATLATLIYAQNFEMPAGYVDDELDNSWLIKIGQNFEQVDELEDVVLTNIHNVGDVKIGDVADITVIDNSGDSYVRLGTDKGVILEIFKSSTSGTNDVSKVVKKTITELEEKYPDINIMVMTDQGDYINLIVKSVLQSMAIGALLAIIILAIFLRDIKPTIVVGISIPLSVLVALIAMYFSNVSLNMLSLSGLALGIGMLVDNSIVVIENIYRLRGKGVEAPRAAVQGCKQVAGAIISSTLTTVCVFLPMIYTSGLVRELMAPMCLTIIYCLLASLFIAMTVVPAASSTILRKAKPKEHKFFDKIQDLYGKVLAFCLKVKIVPIAVALGLLIFSGWLVVRMGIVMIPDITMTTIEASIEYPDDYDKKQCYEMTDQVLDRLVKVEGIGSLGAMAGGDEALFVTDAANADGAFRTMSFIMLPENENAGSEEIKKIMRDCEAAVADLDVPFTISTASSEMDSMMGGSGLSITLFGDDLNELLNVSEDIMDIVGGIDGYENIKNGAEDANKVMHLEIDKNKAMSMGLSVAQIFQEISDKIDNEETSVTINVDGIDMEIKVVDNIDELTKENILDYEFAVTEYDEDEDQITAYHKLSEFAKVKVNDGVSSVSRKNQSRYMTITADVKEGYNITLLTRELKPLLEAYDIPAGYSYSLGGEYDSVVTMIKQMLLVIGLGALFIYLIMVAQFQSLLSPFIVIFTIPLAFTGGFLALWLTGENMSVISMMGVIVLMGTVVNNGIVFVDYTNQLRKSGLDRHTALIATGKTRMRPILMTALTTILAESNLILGDDMGSQLGRGMALVIAGGLAYATLMTLFIIPVMYDILFKKQPLDIDTGSENLDDIPDDAAEYIKSIKEKDKTEGELEENVSDDKEDATDPE